MRKIAVVTGTRAEYGLLYWIIKGIKKDKQLKLQLIVTGTHLLNEFGMTVKEIEKDNFPIAEKIKILFSADTELSIANSMGLAIKGFAKAYQKLKPDILLVLGDRFDIFSAVAAAVPFKIVVAHIHGGESTEGAIDELFRHSITKMSHLHFAATKIYADRIIQMGEQPKNVFCFGAPGIDNIYKLKLLNKEQIAKKIKLPLNKKWGIITFHPETVQKINLKKQVKELLSSIKNFAEMFWVFTFPNADIGSKTIIKNIKNFVKQNPQNTKLFISLGQLNYLSLLKNCAVMVGNSSSGIIEAPSFKLPVVNIGCRQQGRMKAKNVIDVFLYDKNKIITAINKALSLKFKEGLKDLKNPYGKGKTSEKIIEVLKKITLDENIIKKKFYER